MPTAFFRFSHSSQTASSTTHPRSGDRVQPGTDAQRHPASPRESFQKDRADEHHTSWLKHFATLCTFSRFRKRYSFSEEEVLQTRTFSHRQEYKFKFHRLKANILCKGEFPEIRRYLWHIAENCPNELFQDGDGARCSDARLPEMELRLLRKDTNAVPLAQLGLVLAKHRRGRHEAIQRFMLANDSATVAVEVPVYLFPAEAPDLKLDGVLTGHIDVLQVRAGKVWILDYKPDARRETRAKYQLYLYARALSVRTGITLRYFGLAYFDDRDYLEVSVPPCGFPRAA